MGRARLLPAFAWLLAVSAALLPVAARAQFAQYTAPGQLAEPPPNRKQILEDSLKEARWRLGPIRLQPSLGLRDMGYEDSSFGTEGGSESDFTASLGAGLTAYLPTGPKLTWEAHAVPEYVWWARQSDRGRTNGRYGVGVYGYFNRLNVVITAAREDIQGIASPEYERRATTRQERLEVETELRLGVFELFGAIRELSQSHLIDDLDDPRGRALRGLDREERVSRGGVRYRPRGWLAIGVGAERSEVDFTATAVAAATDRSNSGTSPFLEVELDGNRLRALAEVTLRSLEPAAGSRFAPYEDETGRLLVALFPDGRLSPQLYAGRGLVYSVLADYSYFTDERLGVGLAFKSGDRFSVSTFFESGRLSYEPVGTSVPDRQDDFTNLGGHLEWALGRLALHIGVTRIEYDSNLPDFDRTVTSVVTGLRLTGGLVWE